MSLIRNLSILFIALSLAACASHKTKDDPSMSAKDNAIISSDPLDGSVQGSDSQKFPGLSTVHFPYDSSVVSGADAKVIADDAKWIKAHPGLKIQIEGHCDERGSIEYNLALGERRAKVIYRALIAAGIEKERLSTISYGEERPIASGDSEEAFAKNRRANFVPLGPVTNALTSTAH